MTTGDENLRAMIDRHLDSDNDPSALPPKKPLCEDCQHGYGISIDDCVECEYLNCVSVLDYSDEEENT